MKKVINTLKSPLVIAAIIFILLGLALIIWPSVVSTVICYGLGGLLIIFAKADRKALLIRHRLNFFPEGQREHRQHHQ